LRTKAILVLPHSTSLRRRTRTRCPRLARGRAGSA
jgi:hypothetical protein